MNIVLRDALRMKVRAPPLKVVAPSLLCISKKTPYRFSADSLPNEPAEIRCFCTPAQERRLENGYALRKSPLHTRLREPLGNTWSCTDALNVCNCFEVQRVALRSSVAMLPILGS